MKGFILFMVFTIALSVGGFATSAQADSVKHRKGQYYKPELQNVLVGFKIPTVRDATRTHRSADSASEAALEMRLIAQTRARFLDHLRSYSFRVTRTYDTLPVVALAIEPLGLRALESDPLVTGIEVDDFHLPTLGDSIPLVKADTVWDAGFSGKDLAIAVLDTGVDRAHPFLFNKVVYEACFSTTDPTQGLSSMCPQGVEMAQGTGSAEPCIVNIDSCDHGTHVAGIAAGSGRTEWGVARDSDIIAIQVFSRHDDRGRDTRCKDLGSDSPCLVAMTNDILAGLDEVKKISSAYSGRFDIAAVNLSLGSSLFTSNCDATFPTMFKAVDSLRSVFIATVVSGGNDAASDALSQPACLSNVISVAASDKTDQVAIDFGGSFSTNTAPFLHLLAPGTAIRSSVPGGGYEDKSGSSMAAPHVTGAISILKSFDNQLSVDDMRDMLIASGKMILDPRNDFKFPRLDFGKLIGALFVGDNFDEIAFIKGGPNGVTDYNLAIHAGPTPNSGGGIPLTQQDEAADDYWLHGLSPGRSIDFTALNDLNDDNIPEIAYLKGGEDGVSDYRLIVVSGPTLSNPGGTGIVTQEEAPDDHWLDHWSPGRTASVEAINDLDNDGFQDIAYLKGGKNGVSDYRLIVVSGPSRDFSGNISAGGTGIVAQETAPDDYWLNYWEPGRAVRFTVIKDIDGDGFEDIAYLKGGPNNASDYRLIVVSGPSRDVNGNVNPGGVGITTQEAAPDDYWLNFYGSGRVVDVTRINSLDNDSYDEIGYLKGGFDGPDDLRLVIVTGPTPTSSGGIGLFVQEAAPNDHWLDTQTPGLRNWRVGAIPDLQE